MRKYGVITLFCLLLPVTSATSTEFVYRGLGLKRDSYHTDLLVQIFKHSQRLKNDTITRYPTYIPHQRALDFLATNKKVDIVIGYATQERIDKYKAVHLPLMKGFNGWRMSLIHEDNVELFKQVSTLEQLRAYTPGLFHTWTDNKILAANGIEARTGSSFDGLFQMLDQKRFDFYPMSVIEINNYTIPAEMSIVVEPYIIFTYPVCFYFYVNKDNNYLADAMTEGFEKIINNGIYDQVFEKHYGKIMKKYLTQNRKVIRLTNPYLPKSVPLNRKELWVNFEDNAVDGSSLYEESSPKS